MSSEQYFTAQPASPAQRRAVTVELAGRRVAVRTAGGVFSPAALDTGTRVLLEEAPAPPALGTFLDLGCGWGPIALTMALRSPEALVHAVDVNERALELTAANAAALQLERIVVGRPEDVPADLRFELVWSNPPIRIGKAALHDLLQQWLPRLGPEGEAYLVVQKNLGADSLHRWIDAELPGLGCERYAVSKGYRILKVSRAG